MNYKWWVSVAIGLFVIGIVAGLVTPANIASLVSEELVGIEEFSGILAPFKVSTVILIFIKNALALLFSFALSPIFCLMPILTLSVNGWLLALVSSKVVGEKSLGFVLAGLLPHGVVELPAFFIGEAAALSFGAIVILALFKKERRNLLPSSLRQNLRYLWIALALFLPAAVIETFVTPLLLQ